MKVVVRRCAEVISINRNAHRSGVDDGAFGNAAKIKSNQVPCVCAVRSFPGNHRSITAASAVQSAVADRRVSGRAQRNRVPKSGATKPQRAGERED